LAYDDARGQPVANAPHSGYQRLEAGDAVVLMDTGKPPPMSLSREAHAGCLSFEFSKGAHVIVVNCGVPATNQETWRGLARATAAHSTVVVNDTSSCRFVESAMFRRLFAGSLIAGGPTVVTMTREDANGAAMVRATHNGYAERYGIIHQRTLMLVNDGSRIEGEDVFLPADGETLPHRTEDAFAARFHLHPSVRANRLTDGHGVMLVLPDREVWTFGAYEDQVELEESVYLGASDGPRRTTQIVIYGRARKVPRVRWTFAHMSPTATGTQDEDVQAELPL